MSKTWDERYAALAERMMAIIVAGGDPRELQEEFLNLMTEKPVTSKKGKKNVIPKG